MYLLELLRLCRCVAYLSLAAVVDVVVEFRRRPTPDSANANPFWTCGNETVNSGWSSAKQMLYCTLHLI